MSDEYRGYYHRILLAKKPKTKQEKTEIVEQAKSLIDWSRYDVKPDSFETHLLRAGPQVWELVLKWKARKKGPSFTALEAVVYCKDCRRHYNELKCPCGGYRPDDWYCADGIMRGEDDEHVNN